MSRRLILAGSSSLRLDYASTSASLRCHRYLSRLSRQQAPTDSTDGNAATRTTTNASTSSASTATTSSSSSQSSLAEGEDTSRLQERIRGWTIHSSAELRRRADRLANTVANRLSRLGPALNSITGYHEIEALKRRVVENERRIYAARQLAREAKQAYDDAVHRRSTSQREVNDLLQRKSSWTEDDVHRFTRLVREDHSVEQQEVRAKAAASQAEDAVERHFNELMQSILSRYHEEQVWSDKIRSASTYGSLTVLGLNVAVFVLAIILVEPWKRKRMVQSFERRVVALNEENRAVLEGRMQGVVGGQAVIASELAELKTTLLSTTIEPQHDTPVKVQPPPEQATPALASTRELITAGVLLTTGAGILGYLIGLRSG